MHIIVTDASIKKGICGIGIILVNDQGRELNRHQERLTTITNSWEAELESIRLGIKIFGDLSHLVYNDCKKAVAEYQLLTTLWRTGIHNVRWIPEHLRGVYLHFVAHELSVMARRIKT